MTRLYTLGGEILSIATEAKYLGVIISSDLRWDKQVNAVTRKASGTLNFISRNLWFCPQEAKSIAYQSLVRSTLEYSACAWDPYLAKDIAKLERVNRRAARFVSGDFGHRSSVTAMLDRLGWSSLESRREQIRLSMMYKVVNNLVAVPTTTLIPADPRTRSSHPHKFRTINATCSQYRNSFSPQNYTNMEQFTQFYSIM